MHALFTVIFYTCMYRCYNKDKQPVILDEILYSLGLTELFDVFNEN